MTSNRQKPTVYGIFWFCDINAKFEEPLIQQFLTLKKPSGPYTKAVQKQAENGRKMDN